MKSIVVSIHIPKTGGVTLKNILTSVYGDSFLWFTETNSPRYTFERLRGYDLNSIKCIHGHIGYGIHNYLKFMGIQCEYIVFTRPIEDRLLSYYNYIKTDAVSEHYRWDNRFGWDRDITFYDWLKSCKMADQDNSMVRFLSGCENLNTDPIKYRMSNQDYRMAVQNLDNISFVGSLSTFDDDVERLANTLSWDRIPYYGRDNAHPDHRYAKDLTGLEYNLVRDTQILDYRLQSRITNGASSIL